MTRGTAGSARLNTSRSSWASSVVKPLRARRRSSAVAAATRRPTQHLDHLIRSSWQLTVFAVLMTALRVACSRRRAVWLLHFDAARADASNPIKGLYLDKSIVRTLDWPLRPETKSWC
jgi:hypothetical protein